MAVLSYAAIATCKHLPFAANTLLHNPYAFSTLFSVLFLMENVVVTTKLDGI